MSQSPLLELTYRNPSFPHLGIECMRLSELKRRMPPAFFHRIQRPRFHLLSLHIGGPGVEEVDFVRIPCQVGTLVHVHPGQVIRYAAIEHAEAYMVLFTPEFLLPEGGITPPPRDDVELLSHLQLTADDVETLRSLFDPLEREYRTSDGGKRSEAIMRHLLMALLLRIDQTASRRGVTAQAPPVQRETFVRFRRELEKAFMRTRAVQDYAEVLGCAPKTLNRATLSMAGIPVKQFIDDRVALEAKRLLAHTTLNVSEIAFRLGFSEATNFVKFFRRSTGTLPSEFRDAQSMRA